MAKKTNRLISIFVFLFVFVGLIIRDFKLRGIPFYDWDEGIYATVAREIIKNHSLLTTFNGHVWLNKPPLSHLMIAVVFSVFGYSEFWARMVMVVFAFLMLILVYKLGQQLNENLFKDKFSTKQLFIPVLVTAAAPLFIQRSTFLNTDIILGVSWLGYFLFRENYWARLGFLLLGVWSKSILGFYPLFFEVLTIKRENFNIKNIVKAMLMIIIALSWHIWAYFKFGDYFLKAHFYDNMIKRVTVPIELHFGGRLYYPLLLVKNLNVIIILAVIGYLILMTQIVKEILEKKWRITYSKKWFSYLILLAPLPFFVLLTFSKSKISWYLTTIIPFFSLIVLYLYGKVKNRLAKTIILISVFFVFIIKFIPNTYLLETAKISPNNKLKIARCLSELTASKTAFLVGENERKIRHVLEAAHLQTTTSFIYGGSPSFIYYLNKPIDIYYRKENFVKKVGEYNLAIAYRVDVDSSPKLKRLFATGLDKKCSHANILVYTR